LPEKVEGTSNIQYSWLDHEASKCN